MSSVNKAILLGHLGRDPEVRYTQDGTAVATISLATSDSWKDKHTGERQERVEWHRIVIFGKLAEIAGEYLKKGAQVYFEGSLRTRKWTDKDGVEKYTTEINATEMKMLGRKPGGDDDKPQRDGITPARPAAAKAPAGGFDDMGDSIPF